MSARRETRAPSEAHAPRGEAVSAAEWDAVWESAPGATFFHSRAWYEAWAQATGGRLEPHARAVALDDGTRAVVVGARRRVALGLARAVESSPAGTFGGWIAPRALTRAEAARVAREVGAGAAAVVWRANPYDAAMVEAARAIHGVSDDTTQSVDLRDGMDAVLRRWSKGHRATIRQAQRAGVRVRTARDASDWDAYFDVYRDTVDRWGERATVVYGREVFHAIACHGGPRVRLWLAECDDRVVAGALCLESARIVVYWHGAAMRDYFDRRPVHAMLHEAMRDACERGMEWFDFNPSGGLEGVRAFKRGFGAVELPSPVVWRHAAWVRAGVRLKRLLRRR